MHRHTRLTVEINGPKGWEIVHEETCSLTTQSALREANAGNTGTYAASKFTELLLKGWDVRLTSEEIRGMGSPVPPDSFNRPNDPRDR